MSRFDRTAMKHARLYSVLPRVGRVRSNSASRTLYTNTTSLSSSLGSFFDPAPPPPPNTRLTAHRLPIEARGEVEGPNNGNPHPTHAPLALAAPHAPANQHPHPAQLALLFSYTPGPAPKAGPAPATGSTKAQRRRGPRYTLDVGAYGIPKRGHRVQPPTDAPLAVQVGEDAYFVRENAMGVADGVGGWARVKHPGIPIRPARAPLADLAPLAAICARGNPSRILLHAPPAGPSASALFARRLMHFCADEVDRASSHPPPHQHQYSHPQPSTSTSRSRPQPIVTPWRPQAASTSRWEAPSSYSRFAPYPASASLYAGPSSLPSSSAFPEPWHSLAPSSFPSSSSSSFTPFAEPGSFSALDEPSADPYENPWAAEYNKHDSYDEWADELEVSPADALAAELDELADGLDVLHILERAYERTLTAHVVPAPVSPPTSPSAASSWPSSTTNTRTVTGASRTTTIPASTTSEQLREPKPKTIPLLAGSSTALVAVLDYVPAGEVDNAIAFVSAESSVASASAKTKAKARGGEEEGELLTPVLKIAHVGDCMGMLVRGGEVAWRSEEMWWRWNTPVQLSAVGASSSSSSSAAAVNPTSITTAGVKGWWAAAAPGRKPGTSASTSSNNNNAEVTPASAAHLFTLPVQAGDIVILASDGLSDNLWDEDVLEEVGRVGRAWAAASASSVSGSPSSASSVSSGAQLFELDNVEESGEGVGLGVGVAEAVDGARLRRRTLAGMLSEALCSRARRVATRRAGKERGRPCTSSEASSSAPASASSPSSLEEDDDETPFARRARETGRVYRGGKNDDISVIVAVIAPAEERGRGLGSGRVEAARAAGS
ncbi:hypothetical protein B0H19DRAFT_1060608 [Mycena capillaripes]|nr:hypothetical protein B0H19DRAFT_1060608 [Mycena capillaripes]